MKKVVKYLVVEKLEGKEQYYLRFTPRNARWHRNNWFYSI